MQFRCTIDFKNPTFFFLISGISTSALFYNWSGNSKNLSRALILWDFWNFDVCAQNLYVFCLSYLHKTKQAEYTSLDWPHQNLIIQIMLVWKCRNFLKIGLSVSRISIIFLKTDKLILKFTMFSKQHNLNDQLFLGS